jgi:dTDP-L-rhamnose 4-epimerase
MRILITGGAGFIGSSLAIALISQGHEITVFDSLSPQIHGPDGLRNSSLYARIHGKVRFLHGSVTDATLWPQALEGQEAVVHLAAETGTGQSMYEVHRYADVNVGGTALMLQTLARQNHGVRRLVVASSRALYGEGRYRSADGSFVCPVSRRADDLKRGRFELYGRDGEALELVPTDEDSRIHPTSVYGITKQTQEQLVMTMGAALGVEPVALRYQNVYGPGQSLSNPYTGILSIFSTRILHGRPIAVFEDGLESRDFVFVDDAVEATKAALFAPAAAGQVIGIGSGAATTVIDAARTLIDKLRRDVPVEVTGAFRVGDIRHNLADLTRARSLLGYAPQVDFGSGIARFAEWVLTQPLPDDGYERSLNELKQRGLMRG